MVYKRCNDQFNHHCTKRVQIEHFLERLGGQNFRTLEIFPSLKIVSNQLDSTIYLPTQLEIGNQNEVVYLVVNVMCRCMGSNEV